MTTRMGFGADVHTFVELDEEMSLETGFRAFSLAQAVRESRIKDVTEICPAKASLPTRFDLDVITPDDMRAELLSLEQATERAAPVLRTRIIEVPVFYNDPLTREKQMRFHERHQALDMTDLEYAAKIDALLSVDALIVEGVRRHLLP